MHCTIIVDTPCGSGRLRCSVPGALKLPQQLQERLGSTWLICSQIGEAWLLCEGSVVGPLACLRPVADDVWLKWEQPILLDAEPTTPVSTEAPCEPSGGWTAGVSNEKWDFKAPVAIGRSPDCTIQLSAASVSSVHALVVPGKHALKFYDLGSRNGSRIGGGIEVKTVKLTHQDTIECAKQKITFESDVIRMRQPEAFPSPAMAKIESLIMRIAPTRAPVVVTGESGSGKESIARSLHEQSGLPGALVCANAACFTPQLARSELFGHLSGSFTGATENKEGLFLAAHNGTLFLDEIADMSLSVQAELLRALETDQIFPVGSTQPIHAKPRIIAATHKDLGNEVKEGRFREDLFYRLFVVNIAIPPLRERPEDILFLARVFSDKFCQGADLSAETLRWLKVQSWKGNIRELRNLFWKASVIYEDAPTSLFNLRRLNKNKTNKKPCKDEVLEVYHRFDEDIQRTAEHLRIHRSTVHRHLKAARVSCRVAA